MFTVLVPNDVSRTRVLSGSYSVPPTHVAVVSAYPVELKEDLHRVPVPALRVLAERAALAEAATAPRSVLEAAVYHALTPLSKEPDPMSTSTETEAPTPATPAKAKKAKAAKKAKVAKAAKAKAVKAPKAKATKVKTDPKIRVVASENPKREGTLRHKNFALYRDGMYRSTFIEKGGDAAHLRRDIMDGFIKLEH